MAVSRSVPLLLHKAVSRNAAETNDHTCVLHSIILIIETRSHSSNIRSHTVSQKLFQTIRTDDLRIVVEKKQILTFGMRSTEIVDGGIVENAIPVHHMSLRIGGFQLFIISECLIFRTVVLHDHILIIAVSRFFFDGINTSLQIIDVIFVRDDNGDQRFFLPEEFRAVKTKILALLDLYRNTDPVIMSFNGTCACVKGVHLAFRILCCGILMASPVIKDPRDMMDLLSSRSFHAAEYKIVILCAVEFFLQHSDLIHDLFFYNKKMADVVYCTQKIDIEVRFEMRLEKFMAIHGHLILV